MTNATEPRDIESDLLPMENVVVGAVLVAAGALGLMLGLVRPDCTLEAVCPNGIIEPGEVVRGSSMWL